MVDLIKSGETLNQLYLVMDKSIQVSKEKQNFSKIPVKR